MQSYLYTHLSIFPLFVILVLRRFQLNGLCALVHVEQRMIITQNQNPLRITKTDLSRMDFVVYSLKVIHPDWHRQIELP